MEPSLSTQDQPDFVVEWQMAEESGEFIDLAGDRLDAEVLVLKEDRFAL